MSVFSPKTKSFNSDLFKVAEFDHPDALLQNPNSHFAKMIMAAASVQEDESPTTDRKSSVRRVASRNSFALEYSSNIEVTPEGYTNPAFVDEGKTPQNVVLDSDVDEEKAESFFTRM